MGRLRTHNNRRRAKELKQGGFFTLQRKTGPTWADRNATEAEIAEDIRFAMEAWTL